MSSSIAPGAPTSTRPHIQSPTTTIPGRRIITLGPVRLPVRARAVAIGVTMAVLLIVLATYSLTLGDYPIAFSQVATIIANPDADPLARYFLLELRPPRMVAGVMAGLALGVAGALSQTVTGNPLGSPDILGFTTGAATGAVVIIVVGGADVAMAAPAAVVGALLTLALVAGLSYRDDGISMSRLVLVGVGVGAGLAGLNRFLIAKAPVQSAMTALQWEAGSLNGVIWKRVVIPALACLLLFVCCTLVARGLTVIQFGDDAVRALGAEPQRTRVGAMVISVLLVAAATAIAGPVAFVAMAAPHASRMMAGTDRPSLILAGTTGAVIVVAADIAGRLILPVGEVPVGLVTGVVGGIYLVVLLARTWRKADA